MSRTVALLTDFGASSEYTGIVKGVLLGITPGITIVDLLHDLPPQSVREGAWVLFAAFRYFAPGTIFCCVVDPGVGSQRQAVAAQSGGYFFVGPDNGLLYPALVAAAETGDPGSAHRAVQLPVPPDASPTFHGRDVFAPAAARLAAGSALQSLGSPAQPLTPLTFFRSGRRGEVVRRDRFGNVVTNLAPVPGRICYRVSTTAYSGTLSWYPTYAAAPPGEPFLVTGSAGTLEFSIANGSAAALPGLLPGDHVWID